MNILEQQSVDELKLKRRQYTLMINLLKAERADIEQELTKRSFISGLIITLMIMIKSKR